MSQSFIFWNAVVLLKYYVCSKKQKLIYTNSFHILLYTFVCMHVSILDFSFWLSKIYKLLQNIAGLSLDYIYLRLMLQQLNV